MKRIVLYREDSYIIVQHISDEGIKYPPMTIRRKRMKTQYEADLFFMRFKKETLRELFSEYSDSGALYVNNQHCIRVRTEPRCFLIQASSL